jgi:hypothetical protein
MTHSGFLGHQGLPISANEIGSCNRSHFIAHFYLKFHVERDG